MLGLIKLKKYVFELFYNIKLANNKNLYIIIIDIIKKYFTGRSLCVVTHGALICPPLCDRRQLIVPHLQPKSINMSDQQQTLQSHIQNLQKRTDFITRTANFTLCLKR